MKLSTRTRYGVRLMLALARTYGRGLVFLKDVAKGEEISEKYLSQIIIPLRGAGLVNSNRGVHGGYTLARSPAEITLRQIVEPFEGDCLVDCVNNPASCPRVLTCASRDVWKLLGGEITETLNGITLEQLLHREQDKVEQSASQNI
ncbi:MAG: Rrf2 family transcriptional regulator [Pseudomonadota bacterium]